MKQRVAGSKSKVEGQVVEIKKESTKHWITTTQLSMKESNTRGAEAAQTGKSLNRETNTMILKDLDFIQ